MRSKVTVVLLFLNVVLFYYIFNYENGPTIHETSRRVLGPETANIEKLVRVSRSAPTVSAEKRAEGWWLVQPFEWPANTNAVSRILNELQLLEHETSFAVADLAKSGQSLADYGLADPAVTLTFTAAGKSYSLKIGDRTEIGNRLYLLSPDGARIHVVNRALADSLGLAAEQLRSTSIFTVPVFEVRSLAVQSSNTKVRIRRDPAHWMFESPINTRAAKRDVETTVNELNALQVRRFVEPRDADATRTGLVTPQLRVTLEGNSRRESLLIGSPVGPATGATTTDEYYAKLEDRSAVFVLRLVSGRSTADQSELLDRLRRAQETLRDKRLLDFDPALVTALNFSSPERGELSLQRLDAPQSTDTWQVVVRGTNGQAPQLVAADNAVVDDLLQRLRLLSATAFLNDAPTAAELEGYGFNRPEREFALSLRTGGGPKGDEPSSLTLQIGTKPGVSSTAFARITSAPYVYEIPPDLLDDIPVSPLHFRRRLIHDLPEGTRIVALTLTDLSTGTALFNLAANGGELTAATLASTNVAEAHRGPLAVLLAESRKLRAKRFVADSFDPARASANGVTQPWRYRLDATLALAGGVEQNTTSSLFVTDRLGGTTQLGGTSESGGLTFELTQELVDALFALTYGTQHDPGPPPAAPVSAPAEKPKN